MPTRPPCRRPTSQQDFSNNVGHHVFIHVGETDINAKKPHATYSHCYVMKRLFSAGRAKQFYSLRNMVSVSPTPRAHPRSQAFAPA